LPWGEKLPVPPFRSDLFVGGFMSSDHDELIYVRWILTADQVRKVNHRIEFEDESLYEAIIVVMGAAHDDAGVVDFELEQIKKDGG
jgi:hypothetical protein